ncbi:NAD(P)/FAD-dependent oxidoreductase [Belnapia sp. T6]|uniref:NAD(P)/FAD-dependent oxidoreductase n=1 Tax=Belnapia mucosa TaxID=2804532 RepID=A0ABS1V0P6_9PROT|nr:NAD(P)/FAD-dependent oxidoreductase [Belnapia mucosa]MBL6455278.1 NAD(P)/FAD-dependent oxidoreductase [Belnapia mucosa]
MPDLFDLVAIGTGVAANAVAERCRAAGWRVVIVDERAFGGTCALRGCEPKKTLWTVAEAADRAHRLTDMGLVGGDRVTIDWPSLMAFKRSFTDPVPERHARAYAKAGIEAIQGSARFVGPNAVEVAGRRLEARHILIASGAKPAAPPIQGAELLATSDDYLALERLPRRLVMLGGGYISFECAHIAARAGAEVTILHADDRPLAHFEQDLVRRLVEHSRRIGIGVELGCRAAAVERAGEGFVVAVEDGRRFEADLALHGLGRVPNLEALDLVSGNVAVEKGRLRLDRHLRSISNPAVFAAGDAAGQGPQLTPVASLDADVVARNLLEGCTHAPDYTGVTSVVFAIPPLASVGLTEEAARGQGLRFEVKQGDMAGYQSVRRTGEPAAAFKLLLEPEGGCVLGAHLLGPQAEEVINLFALAVRLRLPARDLARMLSAYPSGGSNISSMLG